jgi:hypothetical protein
MDNTNLNRRDFNALALSALGGLVAGARAAAAEPYAKDEKDDKDKHPLLKDPHVCRGLNTCKEKGADKKNSCAGQGTCATVKAHECKGENDCKGHGGCGENAGENDCKAKGGCAVPLSDKTWEKTRKRFEEVAKKAKIKVGDAPPKPKKK